MIFCCLGAIGSGFTNGSDVFDHHYTVKPTLRVSPILRNGESVDRQGAWEHRGVLVDGSHFLGYITIFGNNVNHLSIIYFCLALICVAIVGLFALVLYCHNCVIFP